MSKRLSLKDFVAQPAPGPDTSPGPSPVNGALEVAPAQPLWIEQPITVVKLFKRLGLGLRQAASGYETMVEEGRAFLPIASTVDVPALVAELRGLGVIARWHRLPASIDVKALRERLGLTQAAFAARFCLELDSVRNWEQGRYAPDRYALALLQIIATAPEVVDRALAAE